MAQGRMVLGATVARQGEEIRLPRRSACFPLTLTLSLGESIYLEFSGHRRAHPLPKGEYVFSALRTRHVRSESAGLAVAAAFGVRQLVGAFARGTGESAASWLALAEESGDKSPHSKRCRDCETTACVSTPGLCDALNRYLEL